jgi:hypothetical protein
MKIRNKKFRKNTPSVGSALILAVVLTSLLAIVGVLFIMASRVDKIATSAISENRELNLAVEAVIAKIEQQLVLDVPGDPCRLDEEYYDYPDEENAWLASLEPFQYGPGDYWWWYVSDVYDSFGGRTPPMIRAEIISDYQDTVYELLLSDADGDGVADSKWIELPNITSGKGWPIYAAIRVIDNSAMLNVNTAYEFDPCEILERIDGSSQMQINLMALATQPGEDPPTWYYERDLHNARANYSVPDLEPVDLDAYLDAYERNVVWRYNEPNGPYTPFDISDELELRNRFLVNHDGIDSRLEELGRAQNRSWGFRTIYDFRRPVEPGELDEWFISAYGGTSFDPNYAYRHIATTYNMDRIIRPDGDKMLNVNALAFVPINETLRIIREALLAANLDFVDVSAAAAQIAANLIDFRDDNEIVTPVVDDVYPDDIYYGFERPCIYISELVHKYVFSGKIGKSYAVELYKPYFEDNDPVAWRLVIDNSAASPPNDVNVPIVWSGTRRFHVIEWQDPNALLSVGFLEPNSPNPIDGAKWVDPKVVLSWPVRPRAAEYDLYLGTGFEDVNGAGAGSEIAILTTNTYDVNDYNASGLEPETVYYWRVDDVNDPDTWKGEVWMFTTAPSGSGYSSPAAQAAGGWSPGIPVFDTDSVIKLQRFVPDTGEYITVDSRVVPPGLVTTSEGTRSFQRDITLHKCIRRLWDPNLKTPTLGYSNVFVDPSTIMIQAHPYLDPDVYGIEGFKNIGEIGKVFAVDANGIGRDDLEEDVRINLTNPDFQQIFNYLTVFDPTSDTINNDGDEWLNESDANKTPEWKIPGRININTAPWYVIAQLPWMTPEIAQAIYSRRTLQGPFQSIGQLNNVVGMDLYATDGEPNGFPDLTPEDGAADDLEERDLIFARISNLVTVRSDVFTAYILVRIGADGPQKRVIAILDRSNVYPDGAGGITGRVKVRALHPVPDPR